MVTWRSVFICLLDVGSSLPRLGEYTLRLCLKALRESVAIAGGLQVAVGHFMRGRYADTTIAAARRAALWPRTSLLTLAAVAAACAICPHVILCWPDTAVRLRIETGWPLVGVALCAFAAPWLGAFRHKASGRDFFYPASITIWAIATLFSAVWVLGWWAVDWKPIIAIFWMAVFLALAIGLSLGLFCGLEIWRLAMNAQVCDRTKESAVSGRFHSRSVRRPRWGSPHALRVVQGAWDDARHRAIELLCKNSPPVADPDAQQAEIYPDLLGNSKTTRPFAHINAVITRCRNAADSLVFCYGLAWPSDLLTSSEAARRRADTRRQFITLAIVAGSEVATEDYDKFREDLIAAAPNDSARQAAEKFAEAMTKVFKWATAPQPAKDVIRNAEELFSALPNESKKIFAWTWLALVSCSKDAGTETELTAGDVLLMWERFAERLDTSLFPENPVRAALGDEKEPLHLRSLACDPAPALAARRLGELYQIWQRHQPVAIAGIVADRAKVCAAHRDVIVNDVLARFADDAILASARQDARHIRSWVYREIHEMPQIRLALAITAGSFALFLGSLLCLLCPRMPFNAILGLNRINYVQDRRLGGSLPPSGEARVLGRSRDFVALGTASGLYMMHEASRTQFGRKLDGNICDLAQNRTGDGLLCLRDRADITDVKTWGGFSATPWLSAPTQPIWPRAASAPVLAAGFNDENEHRRCVLILQGTGLSAYRLPQGLGWHGTWETGAYADAQIANAWMARYRIYMKIGNGISCVDRVNLQRLPRFEFTEDTNLAVEHFQFGQTEPWAALVDHDGQLWLQSARGGWSGPFFGGHSEIKAAADVRFARLDGSVAWMATADALHAYDTERRSLRTVLKPGAITGIEPITGTQRALVGTAQGLYLIDGSTRGDG